MNKQIRSRTWKYFRQQKWEEFCDFFEEHWEGFAFGMIVIGLILQGFWVGTSVGEGNITLAIIGLCMVGFWVLIGLTFLIICICIWLMDNWEEASKKAEKDFKEKKK